MGERKGTKALELWCRRITDGYSGVNIQNMTTSWRDGLAFCAMVHHFRPNLFDFNNLNKDDVYGNNELAFRLAEEHLGIPALLDAEDMASCSVPDRLSILTYLSQFYKTFGSSSPSRLNRTNDVTSNDQIAPKSETSKPKPASRLSVRRDICAECGLPIFLAEKLVIAQNPYHRVCFRCARCDNQLTPGNYYETEEGQFCCETCPDEEEPQLRRFESIDLEQMNESLSDEEKYNQQYENILSNYQSTLSPILESVHENSQLRLSFITNELLQDKHIDNNATQLGSTFSDDDEELILPNVTRRMERSNNSNTDTNNGEDDNVNTTTRNDGHDIDNKNDNCYSVSNSALDTKESTDIVDGIEEVDTNTADQSNEKLDISQSEDYPEDLNPFDEEVFNVSSTNPFDSDDNHEEPSDNQVTPTKANKPSTKRRLIAPKINLNPFGSDEDDDFNSLDEDIGSNEITNIPVPQPRSVSSESVSTSTESHRKKKPAPPPPRTKNLSSLDDSSLDIKDTPPRTAPRSRKSKPAPPPPRTIGITNDVSLILDESPTCDLNTWENLKSNKNETNKTRQSLIANFEEDDLSYIDKSMQGKWKRKKGPAPPRPTTPHKRKIKLIAMPDVKFELEDIETQQQGLEKQGVRLEQIIRDKSESESVDVSLGLDVEELILELFTLVNEKNELFRRQAELMLLRRQQRLEEEHADVEYQIRILMCQAETTKTDSDKQREEILIQRLVDIVERRNEIIECLEMDRRREVEEDRSINSQMEIYAAKNKGNIVCTNNDSPKTGKKKIKDKIKEKKWKKSPKKDADKDVDEAEIKLKRQSKKKWF